MVIEMEISKRMRQIVWLEKRKSLVSSLIRSSLAVVVSKDYFRNALSRSNDWQQF